MGRVVFNIFNLRRTTITGIFILVVATAYGQHVLTDSVVSASIGMTKPYLVLLPKGYDPARRYPLLVMLHGHRQNYRQWMEKTSIREAVADVPLIVAFPDAENSWYINAAEDPHRRFEDYLIDDIVRGMSRRYSVDTTRRAIAGLSMGGYGAVVLGMRHPGMFVFVGSLSGALIYPRLVGDTVAQPVSQWSKASQAIAFGPPRTAHTVAHDPFAIMKNAGSVSFPYLYLVTGTADQNQSFLPYHRMFADSLRSMGIAYEYHETPGGHTWQYWDKEFRRLLPVMCSHLGIRDR